MPRGAGILPVKVRPNSKKRGLKKRLIGDQE